MARIFVVEDDAPIRNEVIEVLERQGYEASYCLTFDHVVEDILAARPDLVLLDLTLPGTDGQLICRELRQQSDIPVIVLTSRVTEVDEVMSMTMGADDFVSKPYSARVLVARVQALLRRTQGSQEAGRALEHNGVTLDPRVPRRRRSRPAAPSSSPKTRCASSRCSSARRGPS